MIYLFVLSFPPFVVLHAVSSSHVKNNVKFINKLLHLVLENEIPDFRLLNLDMEALFTKVFLKVLSDFHKK